ncbi:MAG: hypothetical protein IPL21_10935 [Saprospirales bacterium]|nr:hypothetical protein [Saprospirales bacterium]
MNTTEHPYKKKIERIAYISFGILVIFIGVVVYFVQIEKKKFRDEGIRADAYVNGMHESGRRKSRNYTMDISMFTEGEIKVVKTDTTGKSESEKKIDAIFDNIKLAQRPIGNYLSLSISITGDSYRKYKPGDKVKVVYLKEDSTKVRLLNDIE